MKKLSRFTVFFTLLASTALSSIHLINLITNLIDFTKTENKVIKDALLVSISTHFISLISTIIIGFAIACILYHLIKIAKNQEKTDKTNDN